jgi:GTP-binding protein LepA
MENIRNFCIISHIDHGKSTLADRLLELTETVPQDKMREQFLDSMDLERGRGITIKMHPVRMEYQGFVLNLIDTPGHVDFNYEVSRSLAAVEGVILLVDAAKGIQAQTIGNLELARRQNLVIIPVINKIDLTQARIKETEKEIADLLKIDSSEILKISAKKGTNVKEVLETAIKRIPSPKKEENPLRALIFDSKYDPYKGVIVFLRVFSGKIKKNEKVYLIQSKSQGEAKEVGIFKPELFPTEELKTGEIGYLATGIKEPGKVRIGDTITNLEGGVEPLAGYKEPKPMVFLSIFPENSNDFELLKTALEKLRLNDSAFVYKPDTKESLGRGFQCGFLGLLHAEIITERLKSEFGLSLVLSTPSVAYKVITQKDEELLIHAPSDWPEATEIKKSQEIWVNLEVFTPISYLGQVLEALESIESEQVKRNHLGEDKVELIYQVPFREIIVKNFYDKLKTASQGFASMNYEVLGWREVKLVKMNILILGRKEEALSRIVPEKEVQREARRAVEKLKEVLPPQLFSLPLQAEVEGKIIARETIRARRKDVTAPLYGGDYTRKRKLLEKQKKGKKELKEKGRIRIPSKVFLEMFRG